MWSRPVEELPLLPMDQNEHMYWGTSSFQDKEMTALGRKQPVEADRSRLKADAYHE